MWSMPSALAQSDSIVFVYKLGHEWKEKKSITNKFPTQVTPLASSAHTRDIRAQLVVSYAAAKLAFV